MATVPSSSTFSHLCGITAPIAAMSVAPTYPLVSQTLILNHYQSHWETTDMHGFRFLKFWNKDGYPCADIPEFSFLASPEGTVTLTLVYRQHYSQLTKFLQDHGLICDDSPSGRKGKEWGTFHRESTCKSRNLEELKALWEIIRSNNKVITDVATEGYINQILENKVPKVHNPIDTLFPCDSHRAK